MAKTEKRHGNGVKVTKFLFATLLNSIRLLRPWYLVKLKWWLQLTI